ncbi:MAG: hypothetical protein HYR91_12300 [Flavobacteriia bacterium]|nr:hypothetical protein [Flavobacteriia bacterium]
MISKINIYVIVFFFLSFNNFCQERKKIIDLEVKVDNQNIPRYIIINTADSLIKETKNQKNHFSLNYIKALAYEDMGLYTSSQKYYLAAMNIALKTNNQTMEITSYLGLGNMYLHREMLFEAGRCYRKLLSLSEKNGDLKFRISAYISMANYLKNKGSLDSSFYFVRKTIDLVKKKYTSKSSRSYYLQINYNTLSKLFLLKKQYDSTLFYANRALIFYGDTHLIDGKISSLSTIAQTFQNKGNFQLAEKILLKEILLIEKLDLEKKFIDVYDLLSRLYEKTGNTEKALVYSRLFQIKKHAIDSLGSESRLFEMNRIFDNNISKLKLGLTIEKLKTVKANLKQRNITYFFIFCFTLLLIIVLMVIIKKRKNEILNKNKILILEQNRYEKELRIKELERNILEKKIEWKNRNIADTAIISSRKTELILNVSSKLKSLAKKNYLDEIKEGLTSEINYLKDQLIIDNNNLALQHKVLENNEDFYNRLKEKFPSLSKSDLELCGLIKLNLSIKEIAIIRNNTFETIKTARFRIRKKLQINSSIISTTDFLNSI